MSVEAINTRPRRSLLNRAAWLLVPAAPFLIVLAVWTFIWAVWQPSKATLPPITDVIAAIVELATSGQLVTHVLASLGRLLMGGLLGIITGVIGGFIVGLNRPIAEMLNPLVIFFNAISGIVWLPLMITWLGIGTALAVFLIWNTVFFIVFQNTALGVQLVPEAYELGVRTLGGGRLHVIRTVTLPGALPYILSGVRTGTGFGWRALIAAELVGTSTGLGQMIFNATEFHRSDIIISGCIIIGCIAVAMDRWILLPIERRTVQRWGLIADTEKDH
jgi:NitT/TauT family transport system permease protein/taurine transport system permease protein